MDQTLNDQNELYMMGYLGNRQVTQYQSIPQSAQNNPRHAGGVIDFDRNYYGADLRWTGKELLPHTTLSAGVALDFMDEDRKGYENYITVNNQPSYGVKESYAVMKTIRSGISTHIYKPHGSFTDLAPRYRAAL